MPFSALSLHCLSETETEMDMDETRLPVVPPPASLAMLFFHAASQPLETFRRRDESARLFFLSYRTFIIRERRILTR